MKEKEKNEKTVRKEYEKPRLRTIDLAAEEVLAAGCKLAVPGPGGGFPSCADSRCSNEAS